MRAIGFSRLSEQRRHYEAGDHPDAYRLCRPVRPRLPEPGVANAYSEPNNIMFRGSQDGRDGYANL
jgi:hypothetical protein